MKHAVAVLATYLVVLASPARAQVTSDFIFDDGYPLAVSYDGSVIAGHLMSFEAMRWTQATGVVSLGRLQKYGAGGVVGISADGTVIASSIASLDTSYTTQALWTQATGWQELMPPPPASLKPPAGIKLITVSSVSQALKAGLGATSA